jgi:rfaE bifunctional protein nucleotidyltransferase chain/domain
MKKFRSRKQLAAISRQMKNQKQKLVTVNGSFDILHPGHLELLRQARAQGDRLAVLLNSDKSVRSYKGSQRPILDQNARAVLLAALECVDYVCLFDEINPKIILSVVRPAIHANGSDWGKNCIERATVERYGGRVAVIKLKLGYSTSNLIKKFKNANASSSPRAVFLDRDGTINLNKRGYIHKIEDFEFVPGTPQALKRLSKSEYKIIVITNQSGIGRGYFPKSHTIKLHQHMKRELRMRGIRLDAIYICPHKPADHCDCRKPGTVLIMQAVKDFHLNLNHSWVIGDGPADIVMGREVNANTIKLGPPMPRDLKLEPNFYARDLKSAVSKIFNVGAK